MMNFAFTCKLRPYVKGSQKTLTVEARFDDGTRFENIINNGLGIVVSSLVLMGSNDLTAITVTNQLVATLQGNSHKAGGGGLHYSTTFSAQLKLPCCTPETTLKFIAPHT